MDGTAGEVGHRVQPRVKAEQNLDPDLAQILNLLMVVNLVQVLQEIDQPVIQMDVQVCCVFFFNPDILSIIKFVDEHFDNVKDVYSCI